MITFITFVGQNFKNNRSSSLSLKVIWFVYRYLFSLEIFYPLHAVRIVKPFEESFKDSNIEIIGSYPLMHRINGFWFSEGV